MALLVHSLSLIPFTTSRRNEQNASLYCSLLLTVCLASGITIHSEGEDLVLAVLVHSTVEIFVAVGCIFLHPRPGPSTIPVIVSIRNRLTDIRYCIHYAVNSTILLSSSGTPLNSLSSSSFSSSNLNLFSASNSPKKYPPCPSNCKIHP